MMIYVLYSVLVILLYLVLGSAYNVTRRRYKTHIRRIDDITSLNADILKNKDIKDLPLIIRKYLKYTNVIGSEKVVTYNVKMTGEMKLDQEKPFAPVIMEQKSYAGPTTRLFYIKMMFKGLKIAGLHHYENAKASMVIRILDLLKVVDEQGESMDMAETVTVLNDMFLMAPASLIDTRLAFEEIDDTNVKVFFTNKGIKVSAVVTFTEEGRLVNFVSNDRFAVVNNTTYKAPWSTPITEYKKMGDYFLPHKGSAIWHFEDGDFEYIKLLIHNVEYNKRKS